MGKKCRQSKPNESNNMSIKDFNKHLETLYEKRASARERALLGLVNAFEGCVLNTFVENTYITLLYRYLNSIKIGSTNEACLASRAIGLLAISVDSRSSAHELLKESVPQLYEALNSNSDSLKRSVVDCLAIVTFVGANDFEVEESMKMLWEICHPKSSSTAKPTTTVIAAAISAWSFLLATKNGGRISSRSWESISFLSTLLEKDDRPVRVAAAQAIALIFDLWGLDECLSREENDGVETIDHNSRPNKILTQVRNICTESGDCPELSTEISIGDRIHKVVTWSQFIKIIFLKRYLGNGFLEHVQKNDLFHDILLEITEKNEEPFFEEERISEPREIFTDKQRTKFRNRCRSWAQERHNGHGHYDVNCEDE